MLWKLAAAAALIGSQSHAQVVTFSNTGGVFNWRPYAVQQPPGNYLDVTLPPTQSGAATPLSISWGRGSPTGSDDPAEHTMYCQSSARVVRSTVGVQAQLYSGGGPYYVYPPQNFPAGSVIGPGLNWQTSATLGWLRFAVGEHWVAGSSFTMGLELTMADGIHYAFANFVLSTGIYGTQYQPTAWGYETRPNVPLSSAGTCYANCDSSTTPPVLNIQDFTCFLNKFAAGDLYANCDNSTTPPVLNILDFSCFLNKFSAGCS